MWHGDALWDEKLEGPCALLNMFFACASPTSRIDQFFYCSCWAFEACNMPDIYPPIQGVRKELILSTPALLVLTWMLVMENMLAWLLI